MSEHLIRIWERRYAALQPTRKASGRRVFSQEEVEHLRLLGHAVREGHRIGDIAALPVEELRKLVAEAGTVTREPVGAVALESEILDEVFAGVRAFDVARVDKAFDRGLVLLGNQGFLEKLASPFLTRLGHAWTSGELTAAHEHFASERLRGRLLFGTPPYAEELRAPLLIACTPSGQLHDLGAAMAVAMARNMGWRTLFLGAGLPAAEIAGAAFQTKARCVALSLVHPCDDPQLLVLLAELRRLLPLGTSLLAGGSAAAVHAEALKKSGLYHVPDLAALRHFLSAERSRVKESADTPLPA